MNVVGKQKVYKASSLEAEKLLNLLAGEQLVRDTKSATSSDMIRSRVHGLLNLILSNGSNETAARSLEVLTSIINNLAVGENQAKIDDMQQEGA